MKITLTKVFVFTTISIFNAHSWADEDQIFTRYSCENLRSEQVQFVLYLQNMRTARDSRILIDVLVSFWEQRSEAADAYVRAEQAFALAQRELKIYSYYDKISRVCGFENPYLAGSIELGRNIAISDQEISKIIMDKTRDSYEAVLYTALGMME